MGTGTSGTVDHTHGTLLSISVVIVLIVLIVLIVFLMLIVSTSTTAGLVTEREAVRQTCRSVVAEGEAGREGGERFGWGTSTGDFYHPAAVLTCSRLDPGGLPFTVDDPLELTKMIIV